MKERITERDIREFCAHLQENEKSGGTVQKYLRDLLAFRRYVGPDAVTKENVKKWKEFLLDRGYAVSTVNSMLTAVNRFLRFSGMEACCVRRLRHQKMIFSDEKRELTRKEYFRLLNTAEKQGKRRLSLVMQTICSTGIRVSELKYITVQSLKSGRSEVKCKGKIRVIFLPAKLRQKLKEYCRKQDVQNGPVFVTKGGRELDRSNIWREMKKLCETAGVAHTKVFPHNLRHLFAKIFYSAEKDIAKLADLLGHSSIETTRIYVRESGTEHGRKMERLHLLL